MAGRNKRIYQFSSRMRTDDARGLSLTVETLSPDVHSSLLTLTGFPVLLFPSLIFNSRSGMFTEMLM